MSNTFEMPVIVVEDSDEDFDTVKQALAQAGLPNPVHRATDGDACLRLLRGEGSPAIRPAFVLLDLNTPGTDGREALREIRKDPVLCAVPVVVLSASANPRDVALCYSIGANAFHIKPVQYHEHLEALRDLFEYWLSQVALPEV